MRNIGALIRKKWRHRLRIVQLGSSVSMEEYPPLKALENQEGEKVHEIQAALA